MADDWSWRMTGETRYSGDSSEAGMTEKGLTIYRHGGCESIFQLFRLL